MQRNASLLLRLGSESPTRAPALLAGLGSGLLLALADGCLSGLFRTPVVLVLASLAGGIVGGALAGAMGAVWGKPRLAAALVLAAGSALEGLSIASKELAEEQRLVGMFAVAALALATLWVASSSRAATALGCAGALVSIPATAWLGARFFDWPWAHLAGVLGPLLWFGVLRAAGARRTPVLVAWVALLACVLAPDPRRAGDSPPALAPAHVPAAQGPSVVLLVIDTLRADEIPRDGALAAFAREGVEFRQCISAAPWTLPAVSSLLTGLYPSQHGAVSADTALPTDITTLAELLRTRGYATGAFTGGAFVSRAHRLDQGFEVFDASCERRFEPFGPHVPLVWRLAKNRYAPLRWLVRRADESLGLAGGLEAALRWTAKDPQRPKFVLLHTYQVHDYYLADPDVDDAVVAAIPLPSARFAGRLTVHPSELAAASQADLDYFHALYRGRVAAVERLFPKLVSALEAQLGADTVWVVTADHGEGFDAASKRVHHGGRLHEDLLRVPLIVKAPGRLQAGRVVEDPVRTIDVLPTVLELLDLPLPEGLAGQALLAAIAGTAAFPTEAFAEERAHGFELLALRAQGWKRITAPGREEAFHLNDDPGEGLSMPAEVPASLREAMATFPERYTPHAPAQIELDESTRAELRALGYD